MSSRRVRPSRPNISRRAVFKYLPRIETRKSVQPLFCGYLFALVRDGRWLAINTCFGVLSVIRFGDVPARVPDREIEALRARADSTGLIKLPPAPGPRVLKRGDRVRVIAFGTTFSGIRTGMSARAREVVLINILGAERQVPVASHLIAAR